MTFKLNTPVAMLVFRRPDLTAQVFERVRQAKPPVLLVVADGPRHDRPGDAEACEATRAIFDQVDWDCEVYRHFAPDNLGCRNRVATGLNWVFSMVEEAIILEDDTLPDPTFFQFCEQLLEKYRADHRVSMISGDNFQFGEARNSESYYFSRYTHIWGWASWRRAWKNYDVTMSRWPQARDGMWLADILEGDPQLFSYWSSIFERVFTGEIDTWDYQLTFSAWANNQLTILPTKNLVTNIGFDERATHTVTATPHANLPAEPMSFPLKHPNLIVRDAAADARSEIRIFGVQRPPTAYNWANFRPRAQVEAEAVASALPPARVFADTWRLDLDNWNKALGNKILHILFLLTLAERKGVQPIIPKSSNIDHIFEYKNGLRQDVPEAALHRAPYVYDEHNDCSGETPEECIEFSERQARSLEQFLSAPTPTQDFHVRGHFWHHQFMPRASTFNRYLGIRPEIVEQIVAKYPTLFEERSIALHMRDTDFSSHLTGIFPHGVMLDDDYYIRAVEQAERHLGSGLEYHLFSDNIGRLANLMQRLGKRCVVHQDSAYVDWAALFLAPRIISSNSTFSWTASLYNKSFVVQPACGYNYYLGNGSVPYGFELPRSVLVSGRERRTQPFLMNQAAPSI